LTAGIPRMKMEQLEILHYGFTNIHWLMINIANLQEIYLVPFIAVKRHNCTFFFGNYPLIISHEQCANGGWWLVRGLYYTKCIGGEYHDLFLESLLTNQHWNDRGFWTLLTWQNGIVIYKLEILWGYSMVNSTFRMLTHDSWFCYPPHFIYRKGYRFWQ